MGGLEGGKGRGTGIIMLYSQKIKNKKVHGK